MQDDVEEKYTDINLEGEVEDTRLQNPLSAEENDNSEWWIGLWENGRS
jgi:hypothetical protein